MCCDYPRNYYHYKRLEERAWRHWYEYEFAEERAERRWRHRATALELGHALKAIRRLWAGALGRLTPAPYGAARREEARS